MKVDQAEQLRLQEQKVQDATDEHNSASQRVRQLRDAEVKAKQAVEAWKRQERSLKAAAQTAEDNVEQLIAEIDSNRPQDGKLQALQDQLREAKEDQAAHEGAYQDSVVAKDKLDEIANALLPDMEQAQQELQLQKTRIEKAQRKVETCEASRIAALYEKNEALEKVANMQSHVTRLEKKRDAKKLEVEEEFIKGAEGVCARVPVTMTVEELDKRLERFQKQYEQEQQEAGGTMEQLTLAHVEAQRAYSDAKKQMDELAETSKVSGIHPLTPQSIKLTSSPS
jgi:chromosome segregation ATPase